MTKFYITTAIDYVNAKPHLGHAYEKIATDIIARWHRLNGKKVFFLTGTDENAQKVFIAAKETGKDIKKFVDENAGEFKKLCNILNISNDIFVRTTDKRHKKVVQDFFQNIYKNGDIYKGKYSGLYCIGCEAFYLEKDLKQGKCQVHDKKPEWIEEENYFFRLSKYQEGIVKHIKENKDFIQPNSRRNEILERLKKPLKDISVSRSNIEWGIPVPFDKSQKIYVWIDALLNYYSFGKEYWPADIHIIGNDINWFHSVIWPAMLMAGELPLPKGIFVHGFLTFEGQKMSKSLGNVVNPFYLAEKYGSDQIRYFLIRDIPFGEDGDFSEKSLKERINGELVSDLGNLVNRVLTLSEKFNGKIDGSPELDKSLNFKKISEHMDRLELHHALNEIWSFVRHANKYINEKGPWKLKGKELGDVLYNLLESLRVIAILLYPFMPETSEKISKQLGVKLGTFEDLKFKEFSGRPKKGELLFKKVE